MQWSLKSRVQLHWLLIKQRVEQVLLASDVEDGEKNLLLSNISVVQAIASREGETWKHIYF